MKIVKFFVVLLLLVSCNGNSSKSQENTNFLYLLIYDSLTENKSSIKDMMNGSVMVKEVSNSNTTVYYYKKCLQGQAYREAENDCQGTGTKSDNYGAMRLQYCDKADNSCNGGENKGVLDGNGNSEAYDSCNSDTTLGRKWRLTDSYHLIFGELYNDTKLIYDKMLNIKLINDVNLALWTRWSGYREIARSSEIPSYLDFYYVIKTGRIYVLCLSDK